MTYIPIENYGLIGNLYFTGGEAMRRFVTFGVVTFLCMTMGGVVLAQ